MKKKSFLICLSIILAGCFFDETNLDASKGYLEEQGVSFTQDTKTIHVSDISVDSLVALRTPYAVFDSSVSMVGSDTNIGIEKAISGFGYVLTNATSKADSSLYDSINAKPYIVIQLDTTFNKLTPYTAEDLDSLFYVVHFVLHSKLTDADFSATVEDANLIGNEVGNVFYLDLKNQLNNTPHAATDEHIIYEKTDTIYFSLSDLEELKVPYDRKLKDTNTYISPYVKLELDSGLTAEFSNNRDTTMHLSIILKDFGRLNADSGTPENIGISRLAVDVKNGSFYMKPSLVISDEFIYSHTIDRYIIKRSSELLDNSPLRVWSGLDTLAFSINTDSLLNRLQDSLGTIEGSYTDNIVKKATLTFTQPDSMNYPEVDFPYTIESATRTYDMDEFNYSGTWIFENQYADESLKNIVYNSTLDSVVKVDVTETIKNILNLGREGAQPKTYFFIADAVIDATKKYRIAVVDTGNGRYIDDNRYNTLLFNSFNFSGLTFDLDIELLELKSDK